MLHWKSSLLIVSCNITFKRQQIVLTIEADGIRAWNSVFFIKLDEWHWIYYKLSSCQCSRFHYRAVTASSGSSPRKEDNGLRNEVREESFLSPETQGYVVGERHIGRAFRALYLRSDFPSNCPLFYHLFSQYLCSFFDSVIHLFIHAFLFLPQLEELRHHVGSLEAEKAAIVKELSSLRFSRMTR